jgi:hypothetical protein
MKDIFRFMKELMKDKDGNNSLRECIIAILMMVMVASWIAQQFFGKNIPEFMFYTFASLIAAGCFGYSLERKTNL